MALRHDFLKSSPTIAGKLFDAQQAVEKSGLDPKLIELVRLRASQINGCAFCIDMHGKAAVRHGESHDRLLGVSAWRLFSTYTERERAALEWTEALTDIAATHVPDELYARARAQFTDAELVSLSWVIFLINGWNRMSIAFRLEPGSLG